MTDLTKQKTIQFWKLKTFNEKLNASIGFLRIHWKPLLKANLVIAGPLFVIGIGTLLFYTQIFIQKIIIGTPNNEMNEVFSLFSKVAISGLLYALALSAVSLVTFEYARMAQIDSPDRFDPKKIFKKCRKKFWRLFGAGALAVGAYYMIALVTNAMSMVFVMIPYVGIILFGIIQFGMMAFFYSFLYIYLPMTYFENGGISKLFKKTRQFLSRDFLSTAGMYLGNKAIQMVLTNGLLVPFIIYLFYRLIEIVEVEKLSPENMFIENRYIFIIFMIVVFIYMLLNTAFNIFHIITSVVQFYSLREKNEGHHVFQTIENFENVGK